MPARSAVMRRQPIAIAPGVHGPVAIIRDGQRRILAREQQVGTAIDNAFGAAKDRVMPVLGVVVKGYERNLTKAQQDAKDAGNDPAEARAKPDHVATENLMAIVEQEMGKFGDQAGVYIASGQTDAIYQGRGDSQAATESAMQQVMDFLRGEWFFRPNDDAIKALMGKASDGNTPLANLLQGLGQSAASLLQETLTAGLAAGTNPREVGQQLEDALNMPRNRAQVIARNEMVDSYREAALANYQENSDVLDGWVWCAELGPRTCSMCIAMNGQVFPLDEEFSSHACCRCAPIPATQGWQDIADGLGIDTEDLDLSDLEDTSVSLPDGEQWLQRQPAPTQQQIMGKGKWALWKADLLKLSDLVAKGKHPQWGGYRYEPSLKDLGFSKEDIAKATAKIAPEVAKPAETTPAPVTTSADTLKLMPERALYTASGDMQEAINDGHDGARGDDLRTQIADELTTRLKDNPAWKSLVEQAKGPIAGMNEQEIAQFFMSAWTAGSAGDMLVTHALKQAINVEFHLTDAATEHIPPESMEAFTAKYGGDGAGLQAFARAMYDNTQAWFSEHHITEVPVYRGVRFAAGAAPDGLPVDGEIHEVEVRLQPASSFSVMADMASNFGTRNGAGESVVMAGMVPVERIFSTPQSGVGMKYEGEMVVLGGPMRMWEIGVHGNAIPEDFPEKAAGLLSQEAHAARKQDDFLADTGPALAKSSAPLPLHTLAELRAMYPDDASFREQLGKQSTANLKAQAKEEGVTLPKGKTTKAAIIDAIVAHAPTEAPPAPPLDDYVKAQADEATAKKVLAQAKRDVTAAKKTGDQQAIHIAEDKVSAAKASYDQLVEVRKAMEPQPDISTMTAAQLGKLKIADLKQMAQDAGVELSGKTKAAIVASIVEHFAPTVPVPEQIDGIQPFQRRATSIQAQQYAANGPLPPGAERMPDGRVVTHGLEGDQEVHPGDWVVQGVNGEYYPIHADSFAKLYEPHADGTPGKFSRKPEQVQAFQWDGKPVKGFTMGKDAQGNPTLTVPLQGRDPLHVPAGDWIVHGETGWRAVDPDVFAKTYEGASDKDVLTVKSDSARQLAIGDRLTVRPDFVPLPGLSFDPFARATEHSLMVANNLYGSKQLPDYIYSHGMPIVADITAWRDMAGKWGIDAKGMGREDIARAIATKYLATHDYIDGPESHMGEVIIVKGTKALKGATGEASARQAASEENSTSRRTNKYSEGHVTALYAINERTLRDPFLLPDVRQYHRMYGDEQLPVALDNLMADTLKKMAKDWQATHPESGPPASLTKRADIIDYLVKSVQQHDGLITSQADVDRLMARDPINDKPKVGTVPEPTHAPQVADLAVPTFTTDQQAQIAKTITRLPDLNPNGASHEFYKATVDGQDYFLKPSTESGVAGAHLIYTEAQRLGVGEYVTPSWEYTDAAGRIYHVMPFYEGQRMDDLTPPEAKKVIAAIGPDTQAKLGLLQYTLGMADVGANNVMLVDGHPVMVDIDSLVFSGFSTTPVTQNAFFGTSYGQGTDAVVGGKMDTLRAKVAKMDIPPSAITWLKDNVLAHEDAIMQNIDQAARMGVDLTATNNAAEYTRKIADALIRFGMLHELADTTNPTWGNLEKRAFGDKELYYAVEEMEDNTFWETPAHSIQEVKDLLAANGLTITEHGVSYKKPPEVPAPAMPSEPVRPENAPVLIETTSKPSPVPDMPQHDAQAQEDWLNKERPTIDWTVADVHPDVLPQVVAKLDDLRKSYPEAYEHLDTVTTEGDWTTLGDTYAYVDAKGQTLHLNPKLFGDPAAFEAHYDWDTTHVLPHSDLTWFVPSDAGSVQGIITHEFGHVLDYMMRHADDAFLHTISPSGIGRVSETWRAIFKTYMPQLEGKLSGYADDAKGGKTQIQIDTERFAELFVLMNNGDPIPGEMGDIAAVIKTFLRLVSGTKRYNRGDYKLASDILNPDQKAQAEAALKKLAEMLGIPY